MTDIRDGKRIWGIKGAGVTKTMEFYEHEEWPGYILVWDSASELQTMYPKSRKGKREALEGLNQAARYKSGGLAAIYPDLWGERGLLTIEVAMGRQKPPAHWHKGEIA